LASIPEASICKRGKKEEEGGIAAVKALKEKKKSKIRPGMLVLSIAVSRRRRKRGEEGKGEEGLAP